MRLIRFVVAATFFVAMINQAHAYGRRHNVSRVVKPSCNFFMPCGNTMNFNNFTKPKMWQSQSSFMPFVPFTSPVVHGYEPNPMSQIVGHPPGCPSRAFCGCGAAVHLFGSPIKDLAAAAHWFKFPRAEPAPKMAAVRQHHVMVLERHIHGSVWEVYDANSGHHLTRIHAKSIAGYRIVNPHI